MEEDANTAPVGGWCMKVASCKGNGALADGQREDGGGGGLRGMQCMEGHGVVHDKGCPSATTSLKRLGARQLHAPILLFSLCKKVREDGKATFFAVSNMSFFPPLVFAARK